MNDNKERQTIPYLDLAFGAKDSTKDMLMWMGKDGPQYEKLSDVKAKAFDELVRHLGDDFVLEKINRKP